jgi:hypothetical protein
LPDSPAQTSKIQYVIVRSDLPHGVQIAQTAHAVSEASGIPPTVVVALSVPDEQALRRISAMLIEMSHGHALIVEDAGPYVGQATAIGVPPITDRRAIRKVTSCLPLAR